MSRGVPDKHCREIAVLIRRQWPQWFGERDISIAFHDCGRLVNPTRPDVGASDEL